MKHTTSILVLCVLPLLAGCTAEVLSSPKKGTHQVYYSVTVDDAKGDNPTRATFDAQQNKYVFSSNDMLYVRDLDDNGNTVYGILYLKDGDDGKTSDVTFEGTLNVPIGFEELPDKDATRLEAVLVGIGDAIHLTNDDGDKIVGISWPQDGTLMPTMAKAVERYSTLTAESTYGEQSFQFSQGTCFLNFSVTLNDGTPANSQLGAYVWTDADENVRVIRSGTVTTVADGDAVKANFVAAFPGGTVLNGAVVGLGERNAISFGGTESKTLEANKTYNVTRTFTRSEATISFAKTAVVKSNPDQSFTNPLTNTGQGNETVTYESSDPSVATVEASGANAGQVSIVGPGTATITATVEDGVNYVYSEHTASYNLTVYDPVAVNPDPEILPVPPKVTAEHVGWVIATDGLAYVTPTGVAEAGQYGVAMIGYVGEPGTADASSDTYRGLAIALNEAATSVKWCNTMTPACTTNPCDIIYTEVFNSMTGIANTERLADNEHQTGTSHTHAAIEAVTSYSVPYFTPAAHHCSNWFLPSTGQWFKVFKACGVATDYWTSLSYCPDSNGETTNRADNYTAMQSLMMAAGGYFDARYWTSTEAVPNTPEQARNAFYVGFNSDLGVNIGGYLKMSTCNVRAFIAF